MSSIMRVRSALTGRCEEWEVIGGLLSRAEGCWTFDARERMPRSSRLTVHAFTIAAENASTATQPPPARAGSFWGHEERFPSTRLSAGCGFRKETIAGMRRNGRDAPIPDLCDLASEREGSTRSGPSSTMPRASGGSKRNLLGIASAMHEVAG